MTADVHFEEFKQELFCYILLWKSDGSVLIKPSFVVANLCLKTPVSLKHADRSSKTFTAGFHVYLKWWNGDLCNKYLNFKFTIYSLCLYDKKQLLIPVLIGEAKRRAKPFTWRMWNKFKPYGLCGTKASSQMKQFVVPFFSINFKNV